MGFLKDFIYLFLEIGEGKEKEREGNIDVREIHQLVASCMPLIQDLAHNPGMCPDWELNQWPFSLQAGTQSTEPHQPELNFFFFNFVYRGKGRKKERERNINRVPLICAPTGDRTHSLGMCPNRESSWWPLALQDDAQRLSYTSQGCNFCVLSVKFCTYFLVWTFKYYWNFLNPHFYFIICLILTQGYVYWFRERETLMWERNMDELPPLHAGPSIKPAP